MARCAEKSVGFFGNCVNIKEWNCQRPIFLKGKSAIKIHRDLMNHKRMPGLHFQAKGYWVSTVGFYEAVIRKYVRDQNRRDKNQT